MRLWGTIDDPTGNNKPAYANTSNTTSNSTIYGTTANTVGHYGSVFGVSRGETANTTNDEKGVQHAGWVSQKKIAGGILRLDVMNSGNLINVVTASGFVNFANNANAAGDLADQTVANASYSVVANVLSITIKNRGAYMLPPTATIANSNASIRVTLSDRAGRRKYETLVSMKGLTGDDTKDNYWFPGS